MERVCCQIPASDLRNFQTTSSIMDAREAGTLRAAASPGPTNSLLHRLNWAPRCHGNPVVIHAGILVCFFFPQSHF